MTTTLLLLPGHTVENDHKGHMRVKPQPEFEGKKYFVPQEGIPDKAAFIGAFGFSLSSP
jgi:hypothetical protein